MFDKLVLTPMLSVMVCPSLKPKSSFGPESPSWALLLISFSCFTHLQGGTQHISTDTEINNASQQFTEKLQHAAFHKYCTVHLTLKPPSRCLLEMVLQSHVEIKRVPSVPEANSYKSTATCRQEMASH